MAISLDIINCTTCSTPPPQPGKLSPQVTLPGPPGTGLHCCKLQLPNTSPALSSALPTPDCSNLQGCLCRQECGDSNHIALLKGLCYRIS